MTPALFHGPEARDRAVARGLELGRPISEPIGDAGLKVDDSRKIIALTAHGGIGDRPPSLVIGPLDQATPEASDALLKTLEDLAEGPVRLVLWADYLHEVIPTIRSRTLAEWCPAGQHYLSPLAYMDDNAKSLCEAVLEQDQVRILGVLTEVGKDWPDLLRAVCAEFTEHVEGEHHLLILSTWERIREALKDSRGSILIAADALLLESV
jgi:hypothetical protein